MLKSVRGLVTLSIFHKLSEYLLSTWILDFFSPQQDKLIFLLIPLIFGERFQVPLPMEVQSCFTWVSDAHTAFISNPQTCVCVHFFTQDSVPASQYILESPPFP